MLVPKRDCYSQQFLPDSGRDGVCGKPITVPEEKR
jgi:hypothetical protein